MAVSAVAVVAAWDELRHAVRAEARRRGLSVADLADVLGRGPSALRTQLSMRSPPSPALQAALRGWVSGMTTSARSDVPTSRRNDVQTTTPARPPLPGPEPRARMCAPSAKNMASGDIVSSPITVWEYRVVRLPDHDWVGQADVLREHGGHGFELVSVSGGVAYMKRGYCV
jgi:hypothetical protein